MLRNFSNPVATEDLETLVAEINANRYVYIYVSRIGLEVEGLMHRAGERRTLAPAVNMLGFAPRIGDIVECSGLGLGSQWRVTAVATGEPGTMVVDRGAMLADGELDIHEALTVIRDAFRIEAPAEASRRGFDRAGDWLMEYLEDGESAMASMTEEVFGELMQLARIAIGGIEA